MCVNFAQWLIYKLLWALWKLGYGVNFCGLLCHFKPTLKLNFHIWIVSRTTLCFGQNMLCAHKPKGKQEVVALEWFLKKYNALRPPENVVHTLSEYRTTTNWISMIWYLCVSFFLCLSILQVRFQFFVSFLTVPNAYTCMVQRTIEKP